MRPWRGLLAGGDLVHDDDVRGHRDVAGIDRRGAVRSVATLVPNDNWLRPNLRADTPPDWTSIEVVPPERYFSLSVFNLVLIDDARGWPMRSLACRFLVTDPHLTDVLVEDGIPINRQEWFTPLRRVPLPGERSRLRLYRYLRALPLRPIWAPFTINTLFYAAILWLIIPGPFVLRRFLRLRRGLCPMCAYPMGESAVCSECGQELLKRARPAT